MALLALPEGQLALELGHEPARGEEDFLVGDGNELAFERIAAFPHWPDPVTLLIGPAASGKTHLAQIFAERSGAQFVPPEALAEWAQADDDTPLIVEDADRGEYDEPALFHLLNQAMRGQRPLLLTARDEIVTWPLRTNDVRSRLRRAASFKLEVTDDIQLSQMLVKLFGDRQIRVDPKIVFYVVKRMERSAEEAAALVELMDRLALARGSAISRSIAAEALARRQALSGHAPAETNWDNHDDE
jgi:chromosomal replication initiation ATPase DnaA